MKTGKALLGVLTGLAAGAVLGLIFAPEKKKKTSEKHNAFAEALNKQIDEKFEKFIGKLNGEITAKKRNGLIAYKAMDEL